MSSGDSRCTTIIKSGELFAVVTPIRRTSSGKRGSATEIRFCTRTCAVSRSVPSSKTTFKLMTPSLVDCDVM